MYMHLEKEIESNIGRPESIWNENLTSEPHDGLQSTRSLWKERKYVLYLPGNIQKFPD
jgi:hypothetical protein